MKLSKQKIHDLEVIIYHTLEDIHYGEGGNYTKTNGKISKTEVTSAKRAIKFLQKLIANEVKL